jgi:hypothetical protein
VTCIVRGRFGLLCLDLVLLLVLNGDVLDALGNLSNVLVLSLLAVGGGGA